MSFIRFFINQRLFINLVSVMALILGYYSLSSLNRESFPGVDLDLVVISAIYPGASPEKMEELVTDLIEEKLKEADGILELESYSIEDRVGIVVTLDPDLRDRRVVIDDIRRLVDNIREFPLDMERPLVQEITSRKRPIGSVVIFSAAQTPYKLLRKKADLLADEIGDLKDIAEVARFGYENREFRVELDPKRLDHYSVGVDQILLAIAGRNSALPVGKILEGGRQIELKTPENVKNQKEISEIIIQANEEGHVIRLGQVARIVDDFEKPLTYTRVDGKASIRLNILKKSEADTIEVIENLEKLLANFGKRPDIADKFELKIIDNDALRIRTRIGVLTSNAVIGLTLVLLSLFMLLNWRIAVITAVGIPLAFAFTFILMNVLGYTLDLLTMLGLIVVVGMIVDDAIIVAENIYRHIENGLAPLEAAVKGTGEVIKPVAATILTSIAAFTPLLMMSGTRGKFSSFVAIVVILALISSWLECMLALPAHTADFAKPVEKEPNAFRKYMDESFQACSQFYVRVLALALRFRVYLLVFSTLLVVGSFYMLSSRGLPFVPFPRSGVEKFMFACRAPQGTALEETDKRMKKIEELLVREVPGVKDPNNHGPEEELLSYRTTIGAIQHRPGSRHTEYGNNYSVLIAELTGHSERNRTGTMIIDDLRKKLAPVSRAAKIDCQIKKSLFGAARKDAVEINLVGKDYDALESLREKIYNRLQEKEESRNYTVEDESANQKHVMRIQANQSTLAVLGLDNRALNITLRAAYEGAVASALRLDGEEVKIRVIFPEKLRNRLDSLKYIRLTNRRGALVPLSNFTKISADTSRARISHKDWRKTVTITVDSRAKAPDAALMVANIKEDIGDILEAKSPEITAEFGGSFKEAKEVQNDLLVSFYIALLFIFLILVTLFGSFFQPLIVMFAIPLGFVGAVITLLAHGQPMSFMAGIGFIGLVGVVVNDSLVMVEFINKSIKDTWEKFKNAFPEAATKADYLALKSDWNAQSIDLVVAGARIRFRPVILTTLTTFLGLIPTAYGIWGDDPYIKPLALVFAWGLIFATFNTLILIPGIYLSYLPARFRIVYLFTRLKERLRPGTDGR